MDIKASLLINPVRENSETFWRYSFQYDFGLLMAIELFQKHNDFVVLFEFHDDILILDSALNPTMIDFYQVKTRDTPSSWTIWNLMKLKNWNSILWKLYSNKMKFWSYANNLFFVTNTSINVSAPAKNWKIWKTVLSSPNDYPVKNLMQVDIDTINEALEQELTTKPINLEDLWILKITKLGVKDSSTHCRWLLIDLVEEINPWVRVNGPTIYRTIFHEITRKGKIKPVPLELADVTDTKFAELIKSKWLSREEFENILKCIGVWSDPVEIWNKIEQGLIENWLKPLQIRRYFEWWKDFQSKQLVYEFTRDLTKIVKKMIIENSDYEELDILQIADKVYEYLYSTYSEYIKIENKYTIYSLIFHQIYE